MQHKTEHSLTVVADKGLGPKTTQSWVLALEVTKTTAL